MSTLTVGQVKKIIDIFENTPSERMQKILASGFLGYIRDSEDVDKISPARFRHLIGLEFILSFDNVPINYDVPIEILVGSGGYEWTVSLRDINAKNFPITRSRKTGVDIKLVHFGRNMKSGEVNKRLNKIGLRSAKIEELLTFGAEFPDMPYGYFPIAALGSIWQSPAGYVYVPHLRRCKESRELILYKYHSDWTDCYRFLAVPK
jgi:hypothetical protein